MFQLIIAVLSVICIILVACCMDFKKTIDQVTTQRDNARERAEVYRNKYLALKVDKLSDRAGKKSPEINVETKPNLDAF